jgi:YD repeat-containing protein
MSKAKSVRETPTETLAKMIDTASEYDARGRLITVNRLNALQFYRLTKAMGVTASNPASMDLAILASSVKKIDATDIAMPLTEREVEFLIQQLDFDGIAAAGEALKKLSADPEAEIEAAKN